MPPPASAQPEDTPRLAELCNRSILALRGEDTLAFLQSLITNDIQLLSRQAAIHSGLLSPQGKILFAFFVVATPDGVLLETGQNSSTALASRLSMYKLRAKVEISDVSEIYQPAVVWQGKPPATPPGSYAYPDPRNPALGHRLILSRPTAEATLRVWSDAAEIVQSGEDEYHAHRITHGVPEPVLDYPLGDTFPHDALFDQLAGVSFSKGCFIGQEVVSRMQHRQTARKRILPVVASRAMVPGSKVMVGEVAVGLIGSVSAISPAHGLAMLRLDRIAEAYARGISPTVEGTPISVLTPDWATFPVPSPTHTIAP